jgi:hypothetical protein
MSMVQSRPMAAIPADLSGPLRPYLEDAADEMVREIGGLVAEYDRPPASRYAQRMRWAVRETVRVFVEGIGSPDVDWRHLTEIYTYIGAYEARKGRGLDGLQTAIRVSGQVACRRFIRDARRLGWSLQTLGQITESLFVFLERIAGAAAQGYSDAQERLATERERYRWRLRDLLIADPPASREAIAELARPANWPVPQTIAVVAFRPPPGPAGPVLPPTVLADWHGTRPYVVVPDPDGPGQDRLVTSLFVNCATAIGPTVPLTQGHLSLRWALRTLELVQHGAIAADGPVASLDHLPTLATSMCAELIELALPIRLGPLMALPDHRRIPLTRTLMAYIESRDNAVAAADRLQVHCQTVRYRMHRLESLLGDVIYDPARRAELMLLLHAAARR